MRRADLKLFGCKLAIATGLVFLAVSGSMADLVAPVQIAQATTGQAEGEVRKVDKDGSKLTVRHGTIRGLDMPGMTMVFKVRDRSILEGLGAGDQVKIDVEKADGALTIIGLQKLK